jgi:hypothetical protein
VAEALILTNSPGAAKVERNFECLFNEMQITPVLEDQRAKLRQRMEQIPSNKLLNASEHDLVQAVVDEFRLEVPVLKEEERYVESQREIKEDVSGNPRYGDNISGGPVYATGDEVIIAVPFEGNAEFFKVQPNRFGTCPPHASVGKDKLLLRFVRMDTDGTAVRRDSDLEIQSIKDYLDAQREAVTPHNNQLEAWSQSFIRQRKERLLASANMAAAIGLPMKRREGVPVTYTVPVKKRVVTIEQIKVEDAFRPEPVLAPSEYEEILRIMSNMAQVMERSPHEFTGMGEETLRSHFLVQLNGAYEGQATGETFNGEGKTDILIRVEGKNIFIAECKFWSGEKAFLQTIDQLLSYLCWRDAKVAVVLFNRNANFTAVLDKISGTTRAHSHCKREAGKSDETSFRYIFGRPADPNREITLTVMAFDVPKPKEA